MSFIDRESYSSSFSSGMNADDFISARKINIVVADSYPMIVQGLRHIFSSVESMQIVAEAHTLSGMASMLSTCECDVLICDYAFGDDPEPDGMRMLETIRRNHPNVKIILLAELRDGLSVQRVMKKGVSAFVVKSSDDSLSLPKIVDKVMRGKRYVDPDIAGDMLCDSGRGGDRQARTNLLSPRELDVVRLLSRGMAVGEIAAKLSRSRKTISTQKANAMKKFGVKTNVDLVDAVRDMLWRG
ncbi:response regulator transcription factor [Burkholderia orbicola]|nr:MULTISPECIES: response regulator transcription factor [Burkholderia]MDN7528134.1 response regulator transcription factor [Burkholderia orbicola]MDN7991038.1 response regulator transcription factor [Burkholderia orbicola]